MDFFFDSNANDRVACRLLRLEPVQTVFVCVVEQRLHICVEFGRVSDTSAHNVCHFVQEDEKDGVVIRKLVTISNAQSYIGLVVSVPDRTGCDWSFSDRNSGVSCPQSIHFRRGRCAIQ